MREKLIELLKEAEYKCLERAIPMTTEEREGELVDGDGYGFYADHLITHGVTVQEWIAVKDRLPTREDANETESILAINKDEKYVGRWVWDIVARWPTGFTYWMPLPQPPKGE